MALLPSSVALAADPIQLGPMTFTEFPGHPLPAPGESQLGGIALSSVAEPKDNLRVLRVWYDPNHTDGQRLNMQIATSERYIQTVSVKLFDWQMVPIAHLAMDTSDELVTLFGSLGDPSETTRAHRQGHFIANVHEVLQNTLLGLRLIQADMLLLSRHRGSGTTARLPIQDIVCDLPKIKGEYLLGPGEAPPSLENNKRAYDQINRFRDQLFRRIGLGRAYVIQDDPMGVGFSVSGERLQLSGNPSWTYWRYRADGQEFLDQLSKDLPSQVIQMLQEEQTMPANRRRRTIEIYNELWNRALSDEKATEIHWMPDEESLSLSTEINREEGANPSVYTALVNSMRFRAFFRYLREQDPAQYANFVNSLPPLARFKSVATPAIIPIGGLNSSSSPPR
jgi:hypothetical protein